MPATENMIEFMSRFAELCKKHRIIVGGCGCHGSPWAEECPDEPERFSPECGFQFGSPEISGDFEWFVPGAPFKKRIEGAILVTGEK